MKAVKRNVLKGFRVALGDQFITVYPNISCSVKDKEVDGQLVVATAKMVTANNAKSRLGATVHTKFSAKFASEVSWQKIDEKTGAAIEEEDITDNGGIPGGGDTPGGGGDNGSGDLPGGDDH
jgi:hypothetical protein